MPASTSPPETVSAALRDMAAHPVRSFVLAWNWKAAALGAIYRALIFSVLAMRSGWKAALAALTIEAAFRIVVTGLYGAVAQRLCNAQPLWMSALLIMLVLPALIQVAEYAIHALAGTPGRLVASIISTAAAGVSALFSWFAMRRGAFLTGPEGQSLAADLRQYPAILLEFVLFVPRWFRRSFLSRQEM